MQQIQELKRININPDRINQLMRLDDFLLEYPKLFRTIHSLRHFLKSRRHALEERGLLINTTIGLLVDAERLTQQLPELLVVIPGEEATA